VILTSSDIAEITGGRLVGPPRLPAREIVTDSRLSHFPGEMVFFAIKGKNHDGHNFIGQMYDKGIRIFVTQHETGDTGNFSDAAFIITDDTVSALQKLAAHRRKSFNSVVIAITGSAGKTVVKEWLAEIAGRITPVVRSPKSYNSQIGVPLSVWKLDDKYKFGIFEAGISKPGEMDNLRRIIDPDIGIITNIGDAHSENFPSDRAKAEEKLKLFRNARTIIYCRDHELIHSVITGSRDQGPVKLVDWSFRSSEASYMVNESRLTGDQTRLKIECGTGSFDFEIPFADRASVENAITVAVTCIELGFDPEVISRGLRELISVAMRMEMKSGINNCQLIEDYYNSDPGSLGMALEYLKSQNGRKPVLILSDFVQSGRDEPGLYGDVAELVGAAGIRRFIGIGDALSRNRSLFGGDASFYATTDEFVRCFNSSDFSNEIILLKGARIFEFEKIGNLLEQQIHQTVLEINLDAVSQNLNEFRRHLDPGTRVMVMVKAFAYGSGPAEIASLLEYHRVSYLAVAYADEGALLRDAGVSLPVMVMNPDPSSFDMLIRYNLEPELYSFDMLATFTSAASRHGLNGYPVHIKIDTGMHRLGFLPDEVEQLARLIRVNDRIKIVSVLSHLAASENPSLDYFSRKQADLFIKAAEQILEATGYPFLRHLLNSAGIARMPEYQFDMVRPGIGIYGVGSPGGLSIKPAGRFVTRISQVKKVKAGEPVGYGCSDISGSDRMIAVLPAGYADGLNRKLGNRNGSLLIKNRRVPLIGNICMDMCMADVTGLDVCPGDEAEIFGQGITIEEIAEKCGTIPYEILTSIPVRVKRIFFRE
jgi:alanine racemase